MNPRRRDGLLAAAVLVAVGTVGTATLGPAPFVDPLAVAVGVVGSLAVEVLFLRYPDRLLAAWERRGVPLLAALLVVVAGVLAARHAPLVVGAVCWGLATYLALLGAVVAGLGNPLAALAR